jgi:hypothetical protein
VLRVSASDSGQVRKQVNQLESFTGVFKRKFAHLAVHASSKQELEATAATKAFRIRRKPA